MPDVPVGDDGDLVREGYQPQFVRTLGQFTAFAAGFSYLSILTGIVQNFYLGYREGGTAFVWTWPTVFLGQLCVAYCFAQLARQYPFCGGVYAWSRRAGSPFLGWLTGWVYLASLIITLASVGIAWKVVLPAISPVFQLFETPGQNAAFLGTILIIISTILNVLGTRWMTAIMNIGVAVELVAAVLLILLLGFQTLHSPWVFTLRPPTLDGAFSIYPFLAAAVMAAYVMYGFDTAGTLAEETVEPRKQTPRAIIQALLAAAGLGMLLIMFAVLSTPNLDDPEISKDDGGLPHVIKLVLGEPVGKLFLVASAIAIFICALAVQATTSRVLFAMARDGALPGSNWLSQVNATQRTPQRAALVIGLGAIGLLLFNMNYDKIMTALVCVCIVWTNLAYFLTTAPMLYRQLRGKPYRTLNTSGVVVNVLAVVWGLVLIINVSWPRSQLYGDEWYQRYAAPLYTIVLLLAGMIVYFGRPPEGRRKRDVS